MAVQFLSQEYVAAAQEALDGHAGFQGAIADKELALQFKVTEMPDGGDLAYYVNIADGAAAVGLGELEGSDVTVTNSYDTAVGISKGDLNTQMAFMTGKLKVSGEMAKLMLNIAAITELTNAMSGIETEY
ncbi:MAG: SCP2 sterol-binding domain-containing protein [Acidimicrobiia bacterium]|nr:SCP2 sterol-binding domain-containing protein [Acidimicrobiia bacterium]